MSIHTMDMSSYEADKIDRTASPYDAEVLCAGWIPGLAIQIPQQVIERRVALPEDLAAASADVFLRKMYLFQR
ncbi:MAG: hypothetical protein WCA64_11980 [Gallionella sp.]